MAFILSILPIALLFVLMLGFKLSGWKSALITLVATVCAGCAAGWVAGIQPIAGGGAPTAAIIGYSLLEGVLKALFPIFLIILMAIFSYNILLESKQIEVIKQQFVSLTDDKGILVLIMVWGFGGLLEGMAGFGTAVAIPAAILIGLGFKPFFSALVALLGNSVPTGFGAVGVPVTTLCNEASVGGAAPAEMVSDVSTLVILQLSPLFFLIPFVILMLTDRKAWIKNLLLALWVGGVSFGVQFACARWLGAETPAILGSVAAIVALILAARVVGRKRQDDAAGQAGSPRPGESLKAWSVYIAVLFFILVSGPICAPVNAFLKSHLTTAIEIPVIGSTFKFGWISNAALMLLLGSLVGGLIQGLSLKRLAVVFARTLISLNHTAITIVSLIALASVMNYTGMIATMANGLVAVTGHFYPLIAPLIGAVGTFVTGSDTSSNILFAKLQVNVAHSLGLNGEGTFMGISGQESDWLLAANTTGATGGKIISPQSIAIATAACEMTDSDDAVLRSALPYALGYVAIGGLMVFLA